MGLTPCVSSAVIGKTERIPQSGERRKWKCWERGRNKKRERRLSESPFSVCSPINWSCWKTERGQRGARPLGEGDRGYCGERTRGSDPQGITSITRKNLSSLSVNLAWQPRRLMHSERGRFRPFPADCSSRTASKARGRPALQSRVTRRGFSTLNWSVPTLDSVTDDFRRKSVFVITRHEVAHRPTLSATSST